MTAEKSDGVVRVFRLADRDQSEVLLVRGLIRTMTLMDPQDRQHFGRYAIGTFPRMEKVTPKRMETGISRSLEKVCV